MSSKYGFACSHLEILSLGLVLAAFMAAILVAILNFRRRLKSTITFESDTKGCVFFLKVINVKCYF